MAISFAERLAAIQASRHSRLALWIAPGLTRLPLAIQRYDEPFLPYGKAMINATRDLVCAYVFDLAAYLSLGAAGVTALERTIAYASGEILTVVHGPFSGDGYSWLLDDRSLNADAVTIVDADDLPAYDSQAGRGAFVVRRGQPEPTDSTAFSAYWIDAGLFIIPSPAALTMRLVGEDEVGAGMAEDFAQQTRAALEKRR